MKIEVLKNKAGRWFWHLKARNGKILAHSESYSRKQWAIKSALLVADHMLNDDCVHIIDR